MKLLAIDNAMNVYESWHYDQKLATPLKIHLEILKLEKALKEDAK